MSELRMKAAVLEKLNTPLIIDELTVPDLQSGQVLVKVESSGICGAQIGEIAGVKGEDKFLPHLMGHEGGGIVIEVGPGVTNVKKNDHVVMHWRKGEGIESAPPKYKRDSGTVGGGWVTTFNEYAVVSENRLTTVPDDLPFDIAALMGCAVTTALGLINNEAQFKIGQSIAVAGSGGVGLNVIQGASLVSGNPIIAIDHYDSKLEMAKAFGATHLINPANEDLRESIIKIAGKKGVDVFVDCTGNIEIIALAYELTAPKGKTIMVGQPHHKHDLVLPKMVRNFTGKMLFDSQGGLTSPNDDIIRYSKIYLNGKLELNKLITHRFKLDDVNRALDKIRNGETGRCIIEL